MSQEAILSLMQPEIEGLGLQHRLPLLVTGEMAWHLKLFGAHKWKTTPPKKGMLIKLE